MAAPYFLRTFNVPLFVPLPYFICSCFANFSTRRINLYIHKATFLSLVKTAALLLRLFKYFSVSMFISLPFLTSLTFLLGLLSAVLIAVAFRHLATKPLFCFACFYFYFAVFSCRRYCRLAAIILAAWVVVPFFVLSAIFNSSRHFFTMPFSMLPSILSLFSQQYRGFLFKAGL